MFNIGVGASSKLTTRVSYWNKPAVYMNDIYFDTANAGYRIFNRGYSSLANLITDTHASTHIIQRTGDRLAAIGPNALSATTDGLYALPASTTNKMLANNYNPSSTTNVTAYRNSVVSIVTRAALPTAVKAALDVADPNNIVSSVYKVVTPNEADSGVNLGSSSGLDFVSLSAMVYIESSENNNSVATCLSSNNIGLDISTGNRGTVGAWTKIGLDGVRTNTGLTTGMRIRNTGTGALTYYFILMQMEDGLFRTPPILISTINVPVTRTGNILKMNLPTQAQQGIGGYVTVDVRGSRVEDLPVLLGFNPSTKIAQTLMDVGQDLGTYSSGLKTIVFAASTGYTKMRVVGQPDIAAVAGNFEDDLSFLSFGGNGFDLTQNQYAVFKKFALSFGPMSDTRFNSFYSQVS